MSQENRVGLDALRNEAISLLIIIVVAMVGQRIAHRVFGGPH